jgi:hypothetical protein
MKLNKIFFVLILTIPFSNYTQYLGGNGRGDVSIILTNVPLPVEEVASSLPTKFELAQNYPNPFNPSTKIKFTIPSVETSRRDVFTTLKVYDVLGNEIATLVNEEKPAGIYEANFSAEGLPSGLYFYTLTVWPSLGSINGQAGQGFSKTRKMVLLK